MLPLAFLDKQLELLNGIKDGEATYQELVNFRTKELGEACHVDTIRKGAKLLMEYVDGGWVRPPASVSGNEVDTMKVVSQNRDGSQSSKRDIVFANEDDLRNPDFLLEAHGYDPTLWDVVSSTHSFWGTQENQRCSSKICVKPKEAGGIDRKKVLDWLENYEPTPVALRDYPVVEDGGENLLVLPIADLHYNMLAGGFTSGNEYNKSVANELVANYVNKTIERVRDRNITKILLVLGNDMFNANNVAGTTQKGTPQDNEGHLFNAFLELSNLMIECVNGLTELAPVDIIFAPGNHAAEVEWYFSVCLAAYFRNNDNVTCDISPMVRKYYKFDKTLFMFTHDARPADVLKLFLSEADVTGVEQYECMMGHLHHEVVSQDFNLTIRRLPTASRDSNWTVASGYKARKIFQAFVYNSENGLSDIMYI